MTYRKTEEFIIILLFHFLRVFPTSVNWSFFLLESEWQESSGLSFLADFNNAVVCMVSILPLISNTFNLFYWSLGTVPNMRTIIGIIVNIMFYRFFGFQSRFMYLYIFSLNFFPLWFAGITDSIKHVFFPYCSTQGQTFLPGLSDTFVIQNPRDILWVILLLLLLRRIYDQFIRQKKWIIIWFIVEHWKLSNLFLPYFSWMIKK